MGERVRGRAGQRMRLRRLRRTNGLCERCLAKGLTTIADVVDHTLPLAQGGEDVDDNTRNLCDPCHLEVTAEQFEQGRAKGMGGCDANGIPTDPAHPWNAAGAREGGGGQKSGRPRPGHRVVHESNR
ncbi:hypothetical protein BH10PSE14_BH10PSE14_04480 [soil metagenome]